nr:hypothetical protein Itr_chr05CG14220 [Ipomoea trifida]
MSSRRVPCSQLAGDGGHAASREKENGEGEGELPELSLKLAIAVAPLSAAAEPETRDGGGCRLLLAVAACWLLLGGRNHRLKLPHTLPEITLVAGE